MISEAKIYNYLDVRQDERWVVTRLLLLSFIQGLATAILFSASNVLFLANLDASNLPLVYIFAATILIGVDVLLNFIEKKTNISTIVKGTYWIITIGTIGLCIALHTKADAFIFYLLIIFERITSLTFNSEFTKISAILFNVRQSKRLFGLLGVAEIPGKTIGLLIFPIIIQFIEIPSSLIIAAFLIVISTIIFNIISKNYSGKLQISLNEIALKEEPPRYTRKKFYFIFPNPYVALLCLFMFSLVGTLMLVEFSFLSAVEAKFDDSKQALATFFALFFAFGQGVILILKGFFTTKIIQSLNIKKTLYLLPGVILFFTVTWFLVQPIAIEIFVMVTIGLMMFFSDVIRISLTEPTFFTLIQPLEFSKRYHAFKLIGFAENFGYGIFGVLLLGIIIISGKLNIPPEYFYFLVLIGLSGMSFPVAKLLEKAFPKAVGRALKTGNTILKNEDFYQQFDEKILLKKLKGESVQDIVYAMDLLSKTNPLRLVENESYLLLHKEEEVRKKFYDIQVKSPFVENTDDLHFQINNEENALMKKKAILAYAASEDLLVTATLSRYLMDKDIIIKSAAIVGLLRYGGIEGNVIAGELLQDLIEDGTNKEKIIAANILGEAKIKRYYTSIVDLLESENDALVNAAIQAATKLKHPRIIPPILKKIKSPIYLKYVSETLVSMGDASIKYIEELYAAKDSKITFKRRLIRLVGMIKTKAAVSFLIDKIKEEQPVIRKQVLQELLKLEYSCPPDQIPIIEQIINEELKKALFILELQLAILDHQTCRLYDALEQDLNEIIDNTLTLFSFISNRRVIKKVKFNLALSKKDKWGNAIELLDQAIKNPIKKNMLILIEHAGKEVQMNHLKKFYPKILQTLDSALFTIIMQGVAHFNRWTVVTTLEYLEKQKLETLLNRHLELKSSPELLIQQYQERIKRKIDYTNYDNNNMEDIEILEDDALFNIVILLKSVSIFHDTPEEVLVELAQIAELTHFDEGEIVFNKGDFGDSMYIIKSGKVKIHIGDINFKNVEPSEFFGEFAILQPEPRTASATAIEPTEVLVFSKNAFFDIMADRMEIVRAIIDHLIRLLKAQNQKQSNKAKDEH